MGLIKALTRAVGIPDKVSNIIQSALPISILFGDKPYGVGLGDVASLAGRGFKSYLGQKNQNVTQSTLPIRMGENPYNVSFQAPSYQAPYYGGGAYDALGYQPTYNPYAGGPSWGYSTMYSQPLTPQYPAYSAPQDRTWEDLAAIALPFFL